MYPISALYNEYLQSRARDWLVKVEIDGTEYDSSAIVDFAVESNLTSGQEFELGTAIYSKLTLRLKTDAEIAPNARVVPYVALQLPASLNGADVAWQDADIAWQDADFPWQGNVTEWLPLGEFFIDNRVQIKNVWEFTCYDKLVYADVPFISQLTYPATMQAVWDEICTSLGYTYDSTVAIDPTYTIQAGPAGFTKRQVLAYIASANAASVYVGKDGTLRFRRFGASDAPVVELTASDYIRVKQTNPVKTFTRVVVVYDTDDDLYYEAGSGDENATLYIENPFATQALTNALFVRLNGFSYTPIEMDARGYPQIEVGDRIRFGRAAPELTWAGADVAWQDADFSWDSFYDGGWSNALNMTYVFRGGLKLAIDAPSKSEQQSEFEVDGSLSGAINRLNRTALREDRSYFGATLTRQRGLEIEREDHKSKVTFNSDELKWEVGGIEKLYYDALADKLKFAGDIVMEGGSISWSNVNAPTPEDVGALPDDSPRLTWIGPTGIYTGTIVADQIEADSLSAISANLGSVTAGSITGVTITGGVITGALIQTSTSFPSVIIAGNEIRAYKSSTEYLTITPDESGAPAIIWENASALQLYFGHIVGTGTLIQSSDTLFLTGFGGVTFNDGSGFVTFDSWSNLYNDTSEQTLQQVLTDLSNRISSLESQMLNKADKNHYHSVSVSGHNHGIASGTSLAVAGGGAVTFSAWGGGIFNTGTAI